MEEIKNEDIILEDAEIVDFEELKKIVNSGIEKYICKITQMIEKNGKLIPKYGTGFFCDIPEKNLKVFITNNHVINEDFLKKEKKIKFEIGKENKEINLELKRYKMTDKFYDFTIIEILKEDNINNFLKVDKYINIYK